MNTSDLVAEIPRLRRYARALLGDRMLADDLVQDTLERAWSRRSSWREGGSLRAWLFGIMHNLRMDQLRRSAIVPLVLDEEEMEIPTRPTQADRLEVRDLEMALVQLPEEQREVLLLVTLEDMSYEEVARTLGIPPGTVMSRLSRGRERLRAVMEGRQLPARLKVVK